MHYHNTRLLEQVHVVVADLAASKRFYQAVLHELGRTLSAEGADYFRADELLVTAGKPEQRSHVHLVFRAAGPQLLPGFVAAGLAAGGRPAPNLVLGDDNNRCSLLDPDGNPVHALVDQSPVSDKPGLLDHKAPFTVCE
ncbi:VOC family protein [Aquitalea sp. LB_tupeE]|uniref:VOC family protein n=1 Tax=Aquitalea sp. LB_tupeE TaxID=2748078 RepID=UPI0015BF3943|nr:VOC family protein [Aquitalea sp. LB_tupeE]NWK76552.1 VOC family protein [Aquitalea sp. LB_tupeE]